VLESVQIIVHLPTKAANNIAVSHKNKHSEY